MKLEDEASDTSILDYGINEAEVNIAINAELGGKLDLSNLPIIVAVKNASTLPAEEFAKIRRNGFGGSDSSILLNVNPFKTLRELIIQKASSEVSEEEKAIGKLSAVRKGNDLEPLVIKKTSEVMDCKILKPDDMYRFKDFPYLTMNFDGIAILPKGHKYAKYANHHGYIPNEIKVATIKGQSHYNVGLSVYSEARLYYGVEPWQLDLVPLNDEQLKTWSIEKKAEYYGIPAYYYTQLQQEMMALDSEAGILTALFEVDWHIHTWLVYKDPIVWNSLKIEGYKADLEVTKLRERQTMPTEVSAWKKKIG